MKTLIIIWGIFMLLCSHKIAYNLGAIKAYDKIDKELMKIKEELSGV